MSQSTTLMQCLCANKASLQLLCIGLFSSYDLCSVSIALIEESDYRIKRDLETIGL